ncbi:TVG0795952 [Thermoplasma volcanium GSS1]|uniref:TVG0795952 protein n=1 Tax=Thermoplasma volcanium (strain ATCC 51530 / DSM 4299 / JCM 9571 / NBRC 15438 / GSS1) TaxID=273116 RepID=Q97AL4_THEVO|nr:TVG0795952 [Thermoplasma volcanium GSS1]
MKEKGLYRAPGKYRKEMRYGEIHYGSGYPITGLIKFLGYYDESLKIANFPSISLNTDVSEAYSAFMISKDNGNDTAVVEGENSPNITKKAMTAINVFKNLYDIKGSFHFYLRIKRKYAGAKGLGESAAVAAAASRSLVSALFEKEALKDSNFISIVARLASGSGSKSVAGPLSLWLTAPAVSHEGSFSLNLRKEIDDIFLCAVPIRDSVSTAEAHNTVIKSPFYQQWSRLQFDAVYSIISRGGYSAQIIENATTNTYLMHSVLISTGKLLWNQDTLRAMGIVEDMRRIGRLIGFSIDTGPSVLVMADREDLIKEFKERYNGECIDASVPNGAPDIPSSFVESAERYFAKH